MKRAREARLRSELAREPDFLRRQELLKALWHLAEQRDKLATEVRTVKAAASPTAKSSPHKPATPRMAV